MPLSPFLEWLERTEVATAVSQSQFLTGFLSSIHLLGLTLVVGSAIVSGLRFLGFLLVEQPLSDVARPVGKAMVLGLAVSLASGLLMFAPRAATIVENATFQIKMASLLAAVVFRFTLYRYVTRRKETGPALLRLTGVLGLTLWFGVGFAGCMFILLE